MCNLRPIYTDEELETLRRGKANRRALADAIAELLRSDPEVRALIRSKTGDLFNRLK